MAFCWRCAISPVKSAPAPGITEPSRFPGSDIGDNLDGTSAWHYGAIEIVAYVTAWVAFPVLMLSVSKRFGCAHNYLRFMVAYNWAAVPQNMLYLPIAMLSVTGIISADAAGFFALLALALIIGYVWFITRTALEIPVVGAAAIVAMDFAISILINGYVEGLH